MPHDSNEKPTPAPEAAPAPTFDFDDLPRVRPVFMLTPDERTAKPAPQKPESTPEEQATGSGEGEGPTPPPAPAPAPAFDFDNLPRLRPNFFLTPDDPPGNPTPQRPATGQAGETSLEFNPDNVPRVRPQFRITTDKPWAKPTLQKPAPASAARKMPGGDWRASALAERANEPPPQGEEPARESEAALRAFLDAPEAEAQIETPLAEDEQDPAS